MADSLKDQILAARTAALGEHTEDFEIPGFGGRLWGTFKALDDYAELRQIGKRHEGITDQVEREMAVGADTLLEANTDTFALIDGKKEPLGVRLGLELNGYLGIEGAQNDREALFLLFDSKTTNLMQLFFRYDGWTKVAQTEAETRVEGKSETAS